MKLFAGRLFAGRLFAGRLFRGAVNLPVEAVASVDYAAPFAVRRKKRNTLDDLLLNKEHSAQGTQGFSIKSGGRSRADREREMALM